MTRILRSAARAPVSEETFHVHLNLNVTIAEPAVAAEPAVVAEPAAVAEPSSPQTLPRTRSAARLARTLVSSPSQAQLARDLQTSVATILPSTVINLSPIKESTVIEEDRASGEITDCDPSSEMSDRADSDDGAPTETSEEEQQLTMQSDSAEQVGDFVKDDASNNIADASDNNADVSNENADVSDKNADASDENTDTSDENTDVSDNNADASDENADASDKMSDSEQDDDNSAEEEGSDTSEGSEADNQAGVGDEDETSIPETLYFHEDISVFSFGEEDDICRQIACEILPIERTAVLEAFLDEKGKVRARLVADTSAEDRAKFNDLWNLINASKAAHNIFGSAACQVIRFRFIKTTALAGILTGSRAWDLNDGLPTLLCRIKSFQIHKSFTQPFKDWCADLALLEIGPDGVMELDGLRNLIFTGMPAGRDAEASGTIYMPSALEKLRALFGKLKSRVWDTWIVSKDVDEDKNVTVRLISKDDLDHVSFGVKDDERILSPNEEMKAYRRALKAKKGIADNNDPASSSTGLTAIAPAKSSSKRPSPLESVQVPKSSKKGSGEVRARLASSETDNIESKMSSMTFAGPPSSTGTAGDLFSVSTVASTRQRMRDASNEEKNAMRKALHDEVDAMLDQA